MTRRALTKAQRRELVELYERSDQWVGIRAGSKWDPTYRTLAVLGYVTSDTDLYGWRVVRITDAGRAEAERLGARRP